MDELERYQAFQRERYQKVLEAFQSSDDVPLARPSLIGSLCAVGHGETAQILFDQSVEALPLEEQAFSRYLIVLCHLKGRQFTSARTDLAQLVRLSRRSPEIASIQLFMCLGLAQHYFFTGQLGTALEHTTAALELALTADHALGKLWSYELMAQTQSMRGAHQAAERHFALAIGQCVLLERRKHGAQIGLALTLHWVRGRPGRNHVPLLVECLKTVPLGQRFARASLMLEMARQEMFAGEYERAEDRLEEIYEILTGTGENRYMAVYAIRQAEIAVCRGRLYRALHHLDFANKLLEAKRDRILLLEYSGLKARIYEALANREEWEYWERQTLRLQRQSEAPLPPLPDVPGLAESQDDGPWNLRQRDIIMFLKHNPHISVSQCRTMFRVSDITACRDLSSLTKAGVLERVGKARATRYRLPSGQDLYN